ncbi:hypothetical protein L3N51_01348 [Metallosphaera sp. J1]|uniref:4Fe-4S binding protein n=1 Tax=Metallosphaera javensis (ex Hofmann et al. 2022) TaxID=99938 RepID=UPI001EDFF604|nr:4Fe-4S binding protein [Metallosphaera javensis (ex Hofmann et al. 2022)]MCG3109058.1 hypothetical protein [Metallosphaera javensis (ex Hofmann et al. 2022)]
MEKLEYKVTGKVKNYERRFNFYVALSTVGTGVFTGLAVLLRQVLLIETGVLLFTTALTILAVNLVLDLTVKSHSNTWVFASPPREIVKRVDRVGKEICEHRPSLLEGDNPVSRLVSKIFKKSWAHFAIILPSFVIFYVVMVVGLIGYQKLGPAGISLVNFASDISWLFWFPLLWLLTWLANGRAWCQTCPFSGQAEWVHRLHPWKKMSKKLGLNLRWPIKYSTIFYSAVGFSVLTWMEEFYNIGGPGIPELTSVVLIYIGALELFISLLFQDRTFCRTICPLSAPLAITTTISPLGTFRAKNPEVCKSCTTKDCMRGNDKFHGCPWFASPGSKENSPMCGLASDCYKACPHDNIDWQVKRFPWLSDLTGGKKRFDIALSVTLLTGVVLFQFLNALPFYSMVDTWLSQVTGWASFAQLLVPGLSKFGYSTQGYPNPLDYFAINVIPILVVLLAAKFEERRGVPLKWGFTSISYALIPIFAASILVRNLPKFLGGSPLILNEILDPTGAGMHNSDIYSTFWGSFLHSLGHDPLNATAAWWVLLVMEAVMAFGIYLGIRASNMLAETDGVSKWTYYAVVLGFGITFMLVTYWMSSPASPTAPFYNPYLGNLLYNPLQATPPF